MIVIIDYGIGNLGSIKNMLKKIGADSVITSDPEIIVQAEKIILPGVGSFDNGIRNLLDKPGLLSSLQEKVISLKTPMLAICLGMQILTKKSEEGSLPGLGWINAETRRFSFEGGPCLKIPHMGWNSLKLEKASALFDSPEEQRFYFVHSYHVVCKESKDALSSTFYGYNFVSSFLKDNIVGVQFHPEKSHKYGMNLFRNFVERFGNAEN